ncbi:GerAB/ArcD/ProY family transporter [Cytobacillus sp. FJAT-53684]|uniref:GerAB/ArcD/ProY family transporter n=1 Tax=Cytobacillus mangrovibacter TaxID=3299024 RepID=A0ABW6K1N1_9BACI
MLEPKGKIGVREFIAIIILCVGTKLSDDTPVFLYTHMKSAAWMAPFIIGAISCIPIYLIIKVLSAYNNKNLADIISHLFGKLFGFIILLCLWIISFTALSFDSAIYADIISMMYFPKTPMLIIYSLLLVVCAYGAKKGLEQIGSVAWSVLLWIKLSLLIVVVICFFQGQTAFLFPFFGAGKWEVVKESSLRTSIYSDFLYLGFIFPYLKSKGDFKKGNWIALSIITIELSFAIASFLMLFDFAGVRVMNFPYHETIRYISLGFLTNIETFFFPFWLLATFVRFTFYLYINSLLFGNMFKIKNFEYLIPSMAILCVFIGMIPETPTFTIFNIREQLILISTPVFIFLPCLLWIAAKIKGDLMNEKAKDS